MSRYFAHSLPGRPIDEWEPLEDHLRAVANLAAEFAGKFGAADWGRVLGLWHDLGKYSEEFQARLRRANGFDAHIEQQSGKVDHSTAGAQHVASSYPGFGDLLAYCIAGHHAGLADRISPHGQSGLDDRLINARIPKWNAVPSKLLECEQPPIPPLSIDRHDASRAAFQLAFLGRMLFSCLVDADFLATERFMSPHRAAERPCSAPTLREMCVCLEGHLGDMAIRRPLNDVNQVRAEVLQDCLRAASMAPGLFSLTVPTGGGKTLSSLAFALKHAECRGLERVICVIPFTSIIEQTANTYRRVFQSLEPLTVLEHHSNVDPDSDHENPQSRLAAENWDAPLVVTTNVQLFESLFAAQTSRCRKLHRLARSVIILDEAQTLPVELLRPCLAALRELAADYGCSVVLCTATQPALDRRDQFSIGLEGIREIVAKPADLYSRMKRVDIRYVGKLSDAALVDELVTRPQFLCVVNTRPHAARLFDLLLAGAKDAEGVFHLSTFMCGAHRVDVLAAIHARLDHGLSCRVVSTQLIEAGVDIDFPVVYRALAGVDSIAQAAGRCNREGTRIRGEVVVFTPTDVRLQGYLRSTADSAGELIPDASDLLDPDVVRRYFELHYWKQEGDNRWDKHRIMECFPKPPQKLHFQYRTASDAFRFITTIGKPVFVPYDKIGEQLIEQLRAIRPETSGGGLREVLRRLQRYTVNIYDRVYDAMLGTDIELLDTGYAVLINPDCYDKRFGFRAERLGYHEPEALIL